MKVFWIFKKKVSQLCVEGNGMKWNKETSIYSCEATEVRGHYNSLICTLDCHVGVSGALLPLINTDLCCKGWIHFSTTLFHVVWIVCLCDQRRHQSQRSSTLQWRSSPVQPLMTRPSDRSAFNTPRVTLSCNFTLIYIF